MGEVTTPITPGLLVHVPDVEVSSVEIVDGQGIKIHFKRAPFTRGPFGADVLKEALLRNVKDDTDRLSLLDRYNIPTRLLPAGALEEFTNIHRAQEAGAFIQKYGPLTGEPTGTMPFESVLQQQKRFWIVLWLNKAVVEQKKSDVKETLKDAATAGLDIVDPSDPSKTIAFHLTKHLALAVPALLPAFGGLQPVLICPDVMTGLYGLLLSAVAENKPWEICENCRQLFRTSRAKKRFCSERCQIVAKQQRYRNRLDKASKISAKTKGSNYGRQRPSKRR